MAMNREKQVAEDCKKWFANHVVEVLHEDGLYRHYRCAQPNTGMMHFHIVTFPGRLIVCGDIGRAALERCPDMLEWARNAAHSTGYFEEKAWQCIKTKEFTEEAAIAAMRWEHACRIDGLDDAAARQKADEQLARFISMAGEGEQEFVNAYVDSDWFDGDFPTIEDYTHEFLRCREAVLWFINNYKPTEKAVFTWPC